MKLTTTLSTGLVTIVLLALPQGCDKKVPPSNNDTQNKNAPTSLSSKPELELADDDLPVPEDFIEESTKEINDDNYKDKLAELGKEVDSDNEQ